MTTWILAIVIVIILVLIRAETFKIEPAQPQSYVKLYKYFNYEGPAFEIDSKGEPRYFKMQLNINPKSLDLNLTKLSGKAAKWNKIRRIEIWEMNNEMPNAAAPNFYNTYTQSEDTYRANEGKFRRGNTTQFGLGPGIGLHDWDSLRGGHARHHLDQLPYFRIGAKPLAIVKPGQRLKGNIPEPVKKIMLIALM